MDERKKNIIKFVLPATMSSICFFLFTIIDGIFVGHGVGTNGLGAVNLAMPFVMLVGAMIMLTTVGGVTIVAIRLGRGDIDGANKDFMNAVVANVFISAVLSLIGIIFAEPICTLMGAQGEFHQLTKDYMFWYCLFLVPAGLGMQLQQFCTNDGSPNISAASVIIGTACNIFGDWLLIFPVGWGLKGAAIATGVSQTISMLIVLVHFLHKKGKLHFFKPEMDAALLRKIFIRGLPEGISQLSGPVAILCTNLMLVWMIGDIGVNAFSLISYVASFSLAVFYGTGQGLQPLFGQSYGAKNADDLKYYFKMGIIMNFTGSVIITILLLFIGGPICRLFGADQATLEFTLAKMPLFAWGFIVMSVNVLISAYLYSTKRTKQAVIINVLRGVVINTAVILLLPRIFGANAIWFTFGIYELIIMVIAIFLLKDSEKNGIVFK